MHPEIGFVKEYDTWIACANNNKALNYMHDNYGVLKTLEELGINSRYIRVQEAEAHRALGNYYNVYVKFDNEADEAEFVLKMSSLRLDK